VTEFRPISMCNIIYKIILMLANRLKIVLSHIISHNQSTFIPGRLISNNILTAYENSPFNAYMVMGDNGVHDSKA
jgi:hypothetical protein